MMVDTHLSWKIKMKARAKSNSIHINQKIPISNKF